MRPGLDPCSFLAPGAGERPRARRRRWLGATLRPNDATGTKIRPETTALVPPCGVFVLAYSSNSCVGRHSRLADQATRLARLRASQCCARRSKPRPLPSHREMSGERICHVITAILAVPSITRLLQGACAGALATVLVGFGWGGWITSNRW